MNLRCGAAVLVVFLLYPLPFTAVARNIKGSFQIPASASSPVAQTPLAESNSSPVNSGAGSPPPHNDVVTYGREFDAVTSAFPADEKERGRETCYDGEKPTSCVGMQAHRYNIRGKMPARGLTNFGGGQVGGGGGGVVSNVGGGGDGGGSVIGDAGGGGGGGGGGVVGGGGGGRW